MDRKGILPRLKELLPPGWKPSRVQKVRRLYSLIVRGEPGRTGKPRAHILHMNARRILRSRDLEQVLGVFEADLQLYIAERARRRIFVHAGVVGWNGTAILLPGPSHTGKSRLVTALIRMGATYYSDEYAVLDLRGRVHPYARPLLFRRRAGDPHPDRLTAEELGASVGEEPLPVGLVALTRYEEGARWRGRRLSPGHAILALLENTVPARRRPKAALSTLQAALANAKVIRGARGEAEDFAVRLLDSVD